MNNFKKAENIGRRYFKNVAASLGIEENELIFTEGDYDGHDAETPKAIIEIKVRTISSTKYRDFILEFKKLEYMLKASKSVGKIPYYVNFFSDGVVMFWDLRKVKELIAPQTQRCKATTAVYGGYVDKVIYKLPSDMAIKKTYEIEF